MTHASGWSAHQVSFGLILLVVIVLCGYQWSTRNQRRYSKHERVLMSELLKEAVQYLSWSETNADAFQSYVQAENAAHKVQIVRRMVANEDDIRSITRYDIIGIVRDMERVRALALQKLAVVCPAATVTSLQSVAAGEPEYTHPIVKT